MILTLLMLVATKAYLRQRYFQNQLKKIFVSVRYPHKKFLQLCFLSQQFLCSFALVLIKSFASTVFFACSSVTCPLLTPLMLLTRWNNNISIIHFTNKGKQQYIGTESRRGNIELYETLMETCKVFKVFDFDLDYFPISSAAG